MRLLLSTVLLAALGALALPAAPADAEALVRAVLHAHPERLASGDAPSGAVSVNASWERGERPDWFVEQQRYGADFVVAGLATGERATVERGLRILDWAFARQGPDGDFPGTGDAMHSTSFVVEAGARAVLALRASADPEWTARADALAPKVAAAARWMAAPANRERARAAVLDPFTHRFWLRGSALLQANAFAPDPQVEASGLLHFREGLERVGADGVEPERGGFDVNYQAVGALYLLRALPHVADPGLRARLEEKLRVTIAPVLARIGPDGAVDISDSTRVTGETGRSGRPKRVGHATFVEMLTSAHVVLGDDTYLNAASRVASGRGWLAAADESSTLTTSAP
jgi:hypothetical protein